MSGPVTSHGLTLRCSSLLILLGLAGVPLPASAADGAGGASVSPGLPAWTRPNDIDPCAPGPLSVPLRLIDAVSRTLCGNPKTRIAWATIRLNAAAVRIAREGYLPNLTATARETRSSTQTRINDDPALDTSANSTYPAASASLSWVLYDFGERHEQLESARQLLAAAQASLDLSLQQVFLQAATDYFGAQAAQATLESARQIETMAARSVSAAHVRVDKGVAPVSDELQARTASAQAIVNRVKAEADLRSKRGALAIDMGLDPDRAITLPQADPDVNMRNDFSGSLRDLIEDAKRNHPSVAVAERELASAEADEKAARDHGYPTISLVAGISRSNEPLTPSLGSPSVAGSVRDRSVGLEIDVPISEPLWKRGLIARARAQVEIQRQTLYGAEQEAAQNVWNSYTALQADTDNLENSLALLDSAQKSLDATQRRYEGGVGTILELITSQTAYASAAQQRIQALSDWRVARLTLGASLGRLNLSAAEGAQ